MSAAYQLFYLPRGVAISSNLTLIAGARVRFFLTTTTNPTPVYQDSGLTTPHTQPVVADSAGRLPPVYLDSSIVYKATFTDSANVEIHPAVDPINDQVLSSAIITAYLTQAIIGGLLYPRTQPEINTSIVPVHFEFPPYVDSRRQDAKGDDTTNDATALQAQINAASYGMGGYVNRRVELTTPETGGAAFKCTTGLTINPLKVTFDGNGNSLDFKSILTAFNGVTLDTAGFSTDISKVAVLLTVRGLRNLIIEAPSYTLNADGVGLLITDTVGDGGGNYFSCCHTIENVAIYGGAYGIKFGNGGFNLRFNNCTILHGVGHFQDVGVFTPATWITTDGGEAVNFYGLFMGGQRIGFWLGSGSIRVHGGNIDGCKTIAKLDQIGTISLHGVYMEFVDGDDTQYKFDLPDSNSRIELLGCEFGTRQDVGVRATKPFANVAGKLSIHNCTFRGNAVQWYTANSGFLVTGAGSVEASGIKWLDSPWEPLVSKTLQWLAYPDINNASALAPFTISKVGAGVNPVRAAAVSDGSTSRDAIDFQIGAGGVLNDDSTIVFTHAVIAGKTVSIVGGFYCPSITGSNLSFEIVAFSYKDSAGNVISGPFSQVLSATSVATWTTFTGLSAIVPSGAETLTITVRLRATGAVASAKHCYISPLGIGFSNGS